MGENANQKKVKEENFQLFQWLKKTAKMMLLLFHHIEERFDGDNGWETEKSECFEDVQAGYTYEE